MIRAQDYGQNLLTASAAADAANDALELTGGHVYEIATEWRLGTGNGARRIVHGNGAIVRATAAMRAVLAIDNNQAVVRDLNLEAQRLADYGVYLHTGSASLFENMDAYQPLVDGFHSAQDSDRCRFVNLSARLCGRIWHTAGYAGPSPANIRTTVTGTCTVGGGVNQYHRVVTFTNLSVPLTSMGLRRGDWISVDPTTPGQTAAMFWAPILSVDSASQLTLDTHAYSPGHADPLQFSIHRGDGFHFGPGRADNNIHRIDTCLAENVACSGFYLGGLYGQRVTNIQVNAAGAHPCVVGGAAQDRHTLGTFIHGFYTENGLNGASSHVLCEGAIGIDLSTSNASGTVGVTNPSTNVGVSINDQYLTDISRWSQPIGYPQNRIDDAPRAGNGQAIVATIPAGANKVTITLAGCTANAFIIPMVRDATGGRALWLESVSIAPEAGSFELRTTGPVSRAVTVDCYVVSL